MKSRSVGRSHKNNNYRAHNVFAVKTTQTTNIDMGAVAPSRGQQMYNSFFTLHGSTLSDYGEYI
jgi:hypothetical protein